MASQASPSNNEIKLRVAEAKERDIGRKIARVDSRVIRELNLSPGDLVEINGKRTTIAIVWPPYKEDDGMGLIRIDPEVRRNAGVSVGEYVRISRANAKPATKIVLAPYETLPFVGDLARIVKSLLLNLPVMKGDTVVVPILGMYIELKVTSTAPTNSVIVTKGTEIEVHSIPNRLAHEDYSKESLLTDTSPQLFLLSENDLIEYFISSGVIDGWYEREVKVGSRIISMESDVFKHGRAIFDWRRSIDLVYHTRDCVWIIEAKRVLNFEAIGQVVVYSTLYAEGHPTRIVKRGIVCYSADEELIRACKKNGITVFQIGRDGTVRKYD